MARLGTAPKEPTPELVRTVEERLGKRGVRWEKPHTGLSPAQRFVVRFDDGSSAFVKAAVDAETERWLRTDHLMMSTLDADFVPEIVAWIDAGPRSVLIIEDLSDAHWPADHYRREGGAVLPVLWKPGQWDLLFAALERVAATPPPAPLPRLSDAFAPEWPAIARDPGPFLELGLCSERWLRRSLDALLAAERELDLSGDALVHHDVRSDNVCFRGDRAILVDWSDARVGSPRYDLANVLSGCALEGGPDAHEVMPDGGAFAAWRAGELARRAAHPDGAPRWLIAVFKRAAIVNLQWAAKSLDLPRWDGREWREL